MRISTRGSWHGKPASSGPGPGRCQSAVARRGSAEIGYRVANNVWLSAGYALDQFDADLTGDAYRGEGPFPKLRFKFDERSLSRGNAPGA